MTAVLNVCVGKYEGYERKTIKTLKKEKCSPNLFETEFCFVLLLKILLKHCQNISVR